MKTDTIAAIATGMTNSGIGIVRISGDDAFEVADRIFVSKSGKKQKVSDMQSHTIHYGFIQDDGEIIDEIMLLIMAGPKSYTCEDTIEIDCHGGVLVMRKILETIIKHGARAAEPGEFTKRAFLNGRIDLSQAESVIDVINSKNDFALKSSVSQLRGSVCDKIKDIRGIIINELAFIESALDDPEHYTLDGYEDELTEKMNNIKAEMEGLLKKSNTGKILREGINTVIAGKPNAGKSSLLNMLVGEERAIVTDIEGTTRDALEEQILINGIGFNIIDTAGIRDTSDIVEKIGVDRSLNYIDKADLVIYVVDSSKELDENDMKIIEKIGQKKTIILLNKSDLATVTGKEEIIKYIDKPVVSISALSGDGIDEFTDIIEDMFVEGNLSFNDQVYITNARHKECLIHANNDIKMVIESINNGMPEDFFTIDMMNAYEELGFIIGEAVDDDLVNEIFSKFCMGK